MDKTIEYEALLKKFKEIAENPKPVALEWQKRTGGKIVGVSGLDVPEPLIHAAGMLPVVLLEKDGPITEANAHVENHQCGYIRSIVDQAILGEYDYMECLILHDCCHIERMTGDALGMYTDYKVKVEFIYLPPALEYDMTKTYTEKEFQGLKARLEKISGNTITEETLLDSIRIFNEQRKALIALYDIRREYPGIISAVDVMNIVAAGMVMPREDHIVMLQQLLSYLEERKALSVSDKIPVVVHGSLCERCDAYVLETIENSGGVVVDDDLYVGGRYFNTLYREELGGMAALVDAYLHRVTPCPTRYEANRYYGDSLVEMMEKARAKVIVMVVVKYCEPHYYAYFSAFHTLRNKKIPQLLIETEHENEQAAQFKTRLQSCFESLEG